MSRALAAILRVVALLGLIGAPLGATRASWQYVRVPAYETFSTGVTLGVADAGQASESVPISGQATLADVNGSWVYALLLLPLILAAGPLIFRVTGFGAPPQLAAAGAFAGFVVITGFSIGIRYIPAAGLALLGALASALERVVAPQSTRALPQRLR